MAHPLFTRDDRVLLTTLRQSGLSNVSCARILGFRPSSIVRVGIAEELSNGRFIPVFVCTPALACLRVLCIDLSRYYLKIRKK